MDKLECYEKQVYALESGNLRKTFELANNIIKIKYKGLEKKKRSQCLEEEFFRQSKGSIQS